MLVHLPHTVRTHLGRFPSSNLAFSSPLRSSSLDLVIELGSIPRSRSPFAVLTFATADCRLSQYTLSYLIRDTQIKMDSLTTHPSTAQQASAFTSPASLSFPGGAGDLTPPSEKDGNTQANGISGPTNGASAYTNGQQQQQGGNAATVGNGVTPTTPAATPGAGQGVSGIVPTLQ